MIYEKIVLRKCPPAYDKIVGLQGKALITTQLILEFKTNGIKTSKIAKHIENGNIHTVLTQSGSIYEFEVLDK